MGQEAEVLTRLDGQCGPSSVRLETDSLLLRSPKHITIRFKEVKSCEEAEGWLHLRFGIHRLDLHLGAAAARWRASILAPPSIPSRLGIEEEGTVAALEFDECPIPDAHRVLEKEYDTVLLNVRTREDLQKLGAARLGVAPHGALWVVYPRIDATLTDSMVRIAGCAGGWIDVRTSRFDSERCALKFVRRTR